MIHEIVIGAFAMSRILSWLRSESKAETLICHAFVEIEMGDSRLGAANLLQGLIDLAPDGGKVDTILKEIQALAVKAGAIAPMPTVVPAVAAAPVAPAPPAVVVVVEPAAVVPPVAV